MQYVRDQMVEHRDEEDWEFGRHGEEMSDLLNIEDNFVVQAEEGNAEGVQFYILQCQQPKFKVTAPFKCIWGCEFQAGDYVVAAIYYQKWGTSNRSYVFLSESRTAYVDAHLIRMYKFFMPPASHRVKGDDAIYQISEDTLALIQSSLDKE
jgi:hypothetical protein